MHTCINAYIHTYTDVHTHTLGNTNTHSHTGIRTDLQSDTDTHTGIQPYRRKTHTSYIDI